jgi:Ca-activated chloride channel homolog
MDFAEPKLLTLAAVLTPLAAWFLFWAWRRNRAALSLFVRSRLRDELTVGLSRRRPPLKRILLTAAVGVLLVALARPRWGMGDEIAQASGRDIVVCVDVSRSMMASDVAPSRLARAKLACYDLLSVARTDRIGLVAFAGTAFLQCPLALDGEAFRQNVAALDPDVIPEQGTSIGDALDEAQHAFSTDSGTQKAVVLITDGEDHEEQALSAARRLARDGIRLFTVGVGTPNGELLKTSDPYGNAVFFKDGDGNPVRSRLNEELLGQIAEAARGFYLPLQSTRTMQSLYARGIAPMAATRFEGSTVRSRIERFQWPLALGLLLLLVEFLIPDASRERPAARMQPLIPGAARVPATALAALLIFCAMAFQPVLAAGDEALRKYESGDYKSARQLYEEQARKSPDDLRLRFNAGDAAYRDGDFKGAAGLFEQVLRAPDLGLQQQGWYNLGNARFRAGEAEAEPDKKKEQWEQALSSFTAAAKLDPADAAAHANVEHVRQALQALPPPPQDSQQDNKGKEPPKNGDKKQGKQKPGADQKQDGKDSKDQNQSEPELSGSRGQTNSPSAGKKQEPGNQGQQNDQGKSQDKDGQQQSEQSGEGQGGKDPKDGDSPRSAPGEAARVGKDGQDQREGAGAGDESKDERKGTMMTVREAEKVLDAQKGQEKALIFRNRNGGENGEGRPQNRTRKPW